MVEGSGSVRRAVDVQGFAAWDSGLTPKVLDFV